MQTLGKFEKVSERVVYLKQHRMPLMCRVVRRWGVPPGTENDIITRGIARISKMKLPDHLADLLLKPRLSDRELRRLDHELIRIITTPEYRYFRAVDAALHEIFEHRGVLLRHASRFTRYELCEDAVQSGSEVFWTRRPQGGLAHRLLCHSAASPEFIDSVRAVLMTYIQYAALELTRANQTPIESSDDAIAKPDDMTDLRISGDKLVRRLRTSGKITEQQEAFWFWRREHPDAPQQEFDVNMSAVEIARVKKELMTILMEAINRECRNPGEEL